jgi:DNA-binding Lrp family transcriptional regulator
VFELFKKINVSYKLEGMVVLEVAKDLNLTEENIHEHLKHLTDRELINGLEGYPNEIDGDAISVVEFNEEAE